MSKGGSLVESPTFSLSLQTLTQPDPGCRVLGSSQHYRRLVTGKHYLHFLYIARGSLSEAQYFIHFARRLGYLSDMDLPAERTKRKFAYLHGLIRSAAKEEVWKITKIVASVASLLVLSVLSTRKGPVVSAPVVL